MLPACVLSSRQHFWWQSLLSSLAEVKNVTTCNNSRRIDVAGWSTAKATFVHVIKHT